MSEYPEIWVTMIVGQFEEPFLSAALESVAWADGFSVVNTDPDGRGAENEATVRRVVGREKRLRVKHLRMGAFDFAKARNASLDAVPDGAYALIVDADDVHWPEFEHLARSAVVDGHDVVSAHFWHHAVFRDLWHSEPHREILFSTSSAVQFENTMGTVHEELRHPRERPYLLPEYRYGHYGYVKPARAVARRWEFYRSLGATIHDYDVSRPDRALDDWPRVCKLFTGEHPPAVRKVLEGYPYAPLGIWPKRTGPARVGLVLLTWNDAENLRQCLRTLAHTTEPFRLVAVDNGSADDTLGMLGRYQAQYDGVVVERDPGLSLAQALNVGFGRALDCADVDYVGWIHPDHRFEWPDWLEVLVRQMDEHPEWAKLGCSEAGNATEVRPGNSQCFIIRRSALEAAGLFDERFLRCGGYEDWEMNYRLLQHGAVMITPDAVVRHLAMGTRRHHDNEDAGRQNADLYQSITGQWEAFV